VESIDKRLDELTTEIERLERAQSALERSGLQAGVDTEAPSPNGRPHVAPAAPREQRARARAGARTRAGAPRRRSATPREEDLEQVLAAAVDGLSANAIADSVGGGYQPTLKRLRELESAGRVRRLGTRRSTRWRLVTDEERIAERTAELERLAAATASRGGSA
jgi:hypothetical protein